MAKTTGNVIVVSRVTRRLSCELDGVEWHERAVELAGVVRTIAGELLAQETIRKELKAKLSGYEARREELAACLAGGTEFRDVVVETQHDREGLKVLEVRTDTGEILAVRPMTDDERQEALPL